MKNLMESFGVVSVCLALWFLPVWWIYRVAVAARKNGGHVLIGGLMMGWIGAGLVAMISPPMSDEAWAAHLRKQEAGRGAGLGESGLVFAGLGVMTLGLLGFMGFLMMM